uniref:PTM/DIR17-like Tudor domain-containing protein n=1 Tax=Lotharella globosa TaxID=91324 RepID=A0A7S3ZFM4_9EUKA
MSDLPGGHLFPHLDHKTRGHDNVSDWLDFRENPRWTEDSTPAAPNPNLIGSVFSRHFRGHGFFWGLVDSFLGKTEKGEEIYRVKYQDGETEDLHAHKIRSFMKETEDRGRASEAPSRDSFDPSESKGITSLEFDLKVNDSVPNSKFRKKYPIANDIMSSKEPPAVLDDLLPGASGFPSAGRDSFVVKPPQFYVDCGQVDHELAHCKANQRHLVCERRVKYDCLKTALVALGLHCSKSFEIWRRKIRLCLILLGNGLSFLGAAPAG